MNRLQPYILILFFLTCILHGQETVSDVDALINEALKEQFGEDFLNDSELMELLGDDFLEELVAEPKWDMDLKVRTGLGYGDNVLYGAYEQMGSSYFFGSVDGLVYRMAEPGEANAYLYFFGEHLSYFEDVDAARLYITQGQISRPWKGNRMVALTGTHIFYDQVFDASADLDSLETFGVSAHQMEAIPHLEVPLPNGWNFKIEGILGGIRYEDSYEDSDNGGGRLSLRRNLNGGSTLEAVFSHDQRRYREKLPRDADGYSAEGRLRYTLEEASLRWLRRAAEPDGWSYSSRVRYLEQKDNTSGYYDYSRVRVTQSVSRSAVDWEASLVAGFTRYDYSVRKANFSGSDKLWREGLDLVLNLKRALNEKAWLFLDGQHEHNRSNSPENVYDASRLVVGVEWGI